MGSKKDKTNDSTKDANISKKKRKNDEDEEPQVEGKKESKKQKIAKKEEVCIMRILYEMAKYSKHKEPKVKTTAVDPSNIEAAMKTASSNWKALQKVSSRRRASCVLEITILSTSC
jgi:hypothetical protein